MPAINFNHHAVQKTLILGLFIALTNAGYGQTDVDTILVLGLKQESNYTERNKFWNRSFIVLRQEVTFNDPNIVDEEFSQVLTIKFYKDLQQSENLLFDIITDSTLIRCSYDRFSVWSWSQKKTLQTGTIKIISKRKRAIVLEFDLIVTEPGNSTYRYKGTRKFKKSRPLDKYHYTLTAGNISFTQNGRQNMSSATVILTQRQNPGLSFSILS